LFRLQAMRMLIIMDEVDHCCNKTFGKNTNYVKHKDFEYPIKKCHILEGKHFIVIDDSITEKLNFFDSENKDLYFQQEVTDDDCIILRPFKMSE
ncbi:MAG: hypothetical protein ACRD9Q_09280, partial [Nitrososphaeraceae archaeon]